MLTRLLKVLNLVFLKDLFWDPFYLLFFINDIVFETKYSTFDMYADDANLSCYNSDVNVIQTNLEYDMHKIQHWCVNNKINGH